MTISRSQMRRQLYQSGGITSIQNEEMSEFDPMEAIKALANQLIQEGVEPREALRTAMKMIEVAKDQGTEVFEDEERIEKAFGGMVDRQQYGLGSLVKSITKGVSKAVKGVAKSVKKVATSDFGKKALDTWLFSHSLSLTL